MSVPQLRRGLHHRTAIAVQREDTCVHTAAASCHSASSIAPPVSFAAGCVCVCEGGEGGRRRGEEKGGGGEGGNIEHPYKHKILFHSKGSSSLILRSPAQHTSCWGLGMRLGVSHCLLSCE